MMSRALIIELFFSIFGTVMGVVIANLPEFRTALKENQNSLFSPFDVYVTLRHFETYPDFPSDPC